MGILIYLIYFVANPKYIIFKNKKLNYLIFVYFFSIIFWFLYVPDIRFSLMLNVFLFLLVIDINLIYKKKLNNLIFNLSIPALSIIFIYTFIYLNFINIYLNHKTLVFKGGWRSIDNHDFKLKCDELGVNFINLNHNCENNNPISLSAYLRLNEISKNYKHFIWQCLPVNLSFFSPDKLSLL